MLLADLEDGQRFTVAAVAYNRENAMVAYGCVDDKIVAVANHLVDLDLRDVLLNSGSIPDAPPST